MMWTDWAGGNCPVPVDAIVSVRLRNGKVIEGTPAKRWLWGRPRKGWDGDLAESETGGDIVAYCEMEMAA